jgi:hypothetical protein
MIPGGDAPHITTFHRRSEQDGWSVYPLWVSGNGKDQDNIQYYTAGLQFEFMKNYFVY